MAQFINMYPVELNDGAAPVVSLKQIHVANNKAHRVGAIVTLNGEPITLGGGCAGTAILASGETVPLTGGITSGNQAYVELDSSCYLVEGHIDVYVTWYSGALKTTLLHAVGTVKLTQTGTVIDPGTIIPSVEQLISDIEDAANSIPADYTALIATIAGAFSTTKSYRAGDWAWQGGTLYRFTKDHAAGTWAASDVEAVVVCDEMRDMERSLSNRVNVLHQLVNYGYDGDGQIAKNSTNKIGITRRGTQYTLDNNDYSVPTTAETRFKINGDLARASNAETIQGWTTGLSLVSGHRYRVMAQKISGETLYASGSQPPWVAVYEAGSSTNIGAGVWSTDKTYYERTFTAGSTPVNIALYIKAGNTCKNAVYQVILEDITDGLDAKTMNRAIRAIPGAALQASDTSALMQITAAESGGSVSYALADAKYPALWTAAYYCAGALYHLTNDSSAALDNKVFVAALSSGTFNSGEPVVLALNTRANALLFKAAESLGIDDYVLQLFLGDRNITPWYSPDFIGTNEKTTATDTTLLKSGVPADAAAAGQRITENTQRADSVSNRVNVLHQLVDYGYDAGGSLPGDATNKLGVSRVGTQITLDSYAYDTPTTAETRIRLSGSLARATSADAVQGWTAGLPLISGNTYRITAQRISGAVTVASDSQTPWVTAYEAGSSSQMGSGNWNDDGSRYERTFTAGTSAINIALYVKAGVTCQNAVYQVFLEDITEGLDAQSLKSNMQSMGQSLQAQITAAVLDTVQKHAETKNWIEDITGNRALLITGRNGFINTSGETVDPYTTTPNATWTNTVLNCSPGDEFTINANGGSNARAWCFTDANWSVISVCGQNVACENTLVTAPANAAHIIINQKTTDKPCYSGNLTKNQFYSVTGRTEPGSLMFNTNGGLSTYINNTYQRSEMVYDVGENKTVQLRFPDADFAAQASIRVLFYTADGTFLSFLLYSGENPHTVKIPATGKYLKILAVSTAAQSSPIVFTLIGQYPIMETYNLNIINANVTHDGNTSLGFSYEVSKGAFSSGRLLLPPNYSLTGGKVPLIVYAHGSGGMTKWNSGLGEISGGSYYPYLKYLSDEGFAVFDCYPWTDKETIDNTTFSPIGLSVCKQSYLAGIRYACSRFNIDINKVSLLCKSQGGHIGHWAVTQTEFPFKAVCLFAPANGISRTNLFYNASCRKAIAQYAHFDATEEEISDFITSGNLASNENVQSLYAKNKALFVHLMPYINGITNGSFADFRTEIETAATQTVPQWLLDLGLPAKPEGASAMMICTRKQNYVKKGQVPCKFWCAFDDGSVSSYTNYAIYYWLCNGGSEAYFRVLPTGTGGHHAMDNDPNALKSSGTTALGIAYTNMPTAYVEVVEFIRQEMGD